MDWVGNAKTYRDNAISAFQNIDNAPQVRARALVYADVMQHMLPANEPRPKAIPSLTAYQCALNAVVLKSYIEHRQAMGAMSFKAAEFIAWADKERENSSRELLDKAIECMSVHMEVFGDSYEGADIGPDEVHELNRTLAIHAFAVMTISFLELERLGDDAPLMHLLLKVSPSEWHLEENIFPLLANVRAVFSIDPGDNEGEWTENCASPSIVGFLIPETKQAFIIDNDLEEAKRLLLKGEQKKVMSQGWLNVGIVSASNTLRDGTYPALLGQKLTMQVVSNQGFIPRQDAVDTGDESEEDQEDPEVSAGDIGTGFDKPPAEFSAAYKNALTKMGMDNPHIQKLRTELDYAIFTGNGHAVLHFFQTLGDKFDEVLPTLGYGNHPLTTALAGPVFDNDDFYGATVFNVFTLDPRALYGDQPLTRALEEEKYEIACAIATHNHYNALGAPRYGQLLEVVDPANGRHFIKYKRKAAPLLAVVQRRRDDLGSDQVDDRGNEATRDLLVASALKDDAAPVIVVVADPLHGIPLLAPHRVPVLVAPYLQVFAVMVRSPREVQFIEDPRVAGDGRHDVCRRLRIWVPERLGGFLVVDLEQGGQFRRLLVHHLSQFARSPFRGVPVYQSHDCAHTHKPRCAVKELRA